MMGAMALAPGTHRLGPDDGTLRVQTYREGVAQKVGHDLVIEVEQWQATLEVGPHGDVTEIGLEADPGSFHVLEGLHGVKPLTDKDRASIRQDINEKILRRSPIRFRSRSVQSRPERLTIQGELELAGASKPTTYQLAVSAESRASGTLSITQSAWGIKPYRAFMGALKVKDQVEIVLDVALPSS